MRKLQREKTQRSGDEARLESEDLGLRLGSAAWLGGLGMTPRAGGRFSHC